MFIATRIVNGVVALLALVLAGYMFSWVPQSHALRETGTQTLLVAVFFVADLIFRKKGLFSDMCFTSLWAGFFLCMFVIGMTRLWLGNVTEGEGGLTYFGIVMSIFIAIPLLLNSTYLFVSFFTKKE